MTLVLMVKYSCFQRNDMTYEKKFCALCLIDFMHFFFVYNSLDNMHLTSLFFLGEANVARCW